MTSISKAFPGWFRRGKKNDPDTDTKPPVGTGDASVPVTGGEGETEPVVVWEAPNRMEAEIVKAHLESEDIPAIITGDVAGRIFGFHTGDLAKCSVLVPAPLADRALEILEAALTDDEEGDGSTELDPGEVDSPDSGPEQHGYSKSQT